MKAARKREPCWTEPPKDALDWLRLCIESSKAAVVRLEREDFDRLSARYGTERARQFWQEDLCTNRLRNLMITLTLQMPEAEQQALAAWWRGEGEGAEPVKPPAPASSALVLEASPVQCNGDAKPGRPTSDALPSADD